MHFRETVLTAMALAFASPGTLAQSDLRAFGRPPVPAVRDAERVAVARERMTEREQARVERKRKRIEREMERRERERQREEVATAPADPAPPDPRRVPS
jgi:hypothetical protein